MPKKPADTSSTFCLISGEPELKNMLMFARGSIGIIGFVSINKIVNNIIFYQHLLVSSEHLLSPRFSATCALVVVESDSMQLVQFRLFFSLVRSGIEGSSRWDAK